MDDAGNYMILLLKRRFVAQLFDEVNLKTSNKI